MAVVSLFFCVTMNNRSNNLNFHIRLRDSFNVIFFVRHECVLNVKLIQIHNLHISIQPQRVAR